MAPVNTMISHNGFDYIWLISATVQFAASLRSRATCDDIATWWYHPVAETKSIGWSPAHHAEGNLAARGTRETHPLFGIVSPLARSMQAPLRLIPCVMLQRMVRAATFSATATATRDANSAIRRERILASAIRDTRVSHTCSRID